MPSIIPKITINGKESTEISGLMIVSLPPITKPAMRAQAEEIDGRDGDQIEKLGFSAYDKKIRIALAGSYNVDDVIEYFNQDGIITFSNEPDKYYRFQQLEGIDFEKLIRFKTADVVFHCQPFKFSTEEEDAIFHSPSDVTINNSGNIYSKPQYEITGKGNIELSVNGSNAISMELGETQQTIIIDTEKMNAYGEKSNIERLISDVSPSQDFNGYDSAWIGGAGKNLVFKIIEGANIDGTGTIASASGFSNLAVAQVKQGETYTATTDDGQFVGGYFTTEPEFNSVSYDNARIVSNSKTITAQIDGFVVFRMSPSFNNAQLEKGSTATSYAPFENICAITGKTSNTITRTGKNLAEFQSNGYIDASGNYQQASSNGLCKPFNLVNGESLTISRGSMYSIGFCVFAKNGSIITRQGSLGVDSYTYTATDDVVIYIWFNLGSGTNSQQEFTAKHAQIETGSTATSFEEYNGSSHFLDFGINQWDESWELGYLSSVDGAPTESSTAIRSTNFCSIMPNTKYFACLTNATDIYTYAVYLYDKNQTYKRRIWCSGQSFTTNADEFFFKISTNTSGVYGTTYNNDISINYPASDQNYHAYKGAHIIWGGSLNVSTGLLTITKGFVDLGELSWQSAGTSDANKNRWRGALNIQGVAVDNNQKANMICSGYKIITANDTYSRINGISGSDVANYIFVYDSSRDSITAEQFAQDVSGIQLCYELAQPQHLQLTASEIMLLLGKNCIFSDSGEITECKYKKDGAEFVTSGNIISIQIDDVETDFSRLMNRRIIGNYDDMTLKKGTNTISISGSGDVDILAISKYSRWL